MSHKKPTPMIGKQDGKICSVCGQKSYSLSGIHPQCAVRQADAPRARQIKAQRKLAEKNSSEGKKRGRTSWNKKKCPKCGAETHARSKLCECGHDFFGA